MNWLKSKTLWFAFTVAFIGMVEEIVPFVPSEHQGKILVAIACGTAVLRIITKKPLTEK